MEIKPKWIFCLLLSTNIIINLDQGIIPAAIQQIEDSLELTSEQLGYLGSQVYAGVTLVCLFGGKLFLHFNSKMIVMISYIGMITSLTLFPLNYGSSWPFYIFRFLTGCSKAPMMIYFPVWVDNFGGESKTIWITILQGVIPLGIFVGYSLSSVISSLWQWQAAFYIQVIMLTVCATFFIIFVRNTDFDIKKCTKSKLERKSINEEQQSASLLAQNTKRSYCSTMIELYSIKLWLCCTIVISILYFIVTGIQFWMTDYMIHEMHQDKQTVNIVFAIVSITAPVFGCITGGLIAQKLGGYQRAKSLYVCVLYCSLCCISAAPVPFTETFWFGALCLWLLLFFGGAIVPPLMGIMLSSVPKHLKAFANSSTTMFQNLFGFLPAPSIYGFLMERYNSQVAVFALMYYSFVGLLVMLLAVYFRRQQNNKKVAFEEVFAQQDDSKSSVLHDQENFNLTVRVLQYGDAPLVTSLTPHIDDQILDYNDQELVNQKEI
ncbi:unnamed protein product (macronuclear) [Paramecium tetraurelia]|uniref:Major facilitator superfamily (MFS) profile domain-containing protein n=1 Tax=Paramecium tetraurelia TaxID=5888 RepID=A0DN58_PARTE|nr:uncharacterized protein GSPATT00018680001 [Paramecium tetraurelia]CAK84475.1 unnamed protein product [Paramecium tetraurelia]|eukprot:XP_001451872.1 hypothetical protein (macronuclear) [Paramecium tetraurelia strain d4-2]